MAVTDYVVVVTIHVYVQYHNANMCYISTHTFFFQRLGVFLGRIRVFSVAGTSLKHAVWSHFRVCTYIFQMITWFQTFCMRQNVTSNVANIRANVVLKLRIHVYFTVNVVFKDVKVLG